MIIDLTKTEELCRKLSEITGKAVSIDYELFLHRSGLETECFKLWVEDDFGSKKIETIDKLNTCLEYAIEYQQKTKELTCD